MLIAELLQARTAPLRRLSAQMGHSVDAAMCASIGAGWPSERHSRARFAMAQTTPFAGTILP